MRASVSPTAEQLRDEMECVVLPPRAGAEPSNRPPVEIFLGTEPAQYRANRVFGYSIEKVRDPGREVRISLMSELPGFDRRGWTTGFTNYRFAIPAFCAGRGRAIYNDEDEIYLSDPGRLFDLELGDRGYLAISDTESSVMLIDCDRMASTWTLSEAQRGWKRALLRKASKATGHRGDLDPHWNARDEEFVPGRSHLLHYTTLHTQPWRPFPERFVYQEGSYTQLWHDLERDAIAEGFDLFRRDAPSKRFLAHAARLERVSRGELPSAFAERGVLARAVESLAREAKAKSLIELLPDLRGQGEIRPGRFGADYEVRTGLLEWLAGSPAASSHDGVVCVDGLEALPVWDVPWIVDTLFARARRFVFAAVRCAPPPPRRFLHPPAGTAFTPAWWRSHFEAAAVRHPHVRFELLTTPGRDFERDPAHVAFGGPRLDATPPRIALSVDAEGEDAAELAIQARVLADSLAGEPVRLEADLGMDRARASGPSADRMVGHAPDLVIAAGAAGSARARAIRTSAGGRCLVVALGRAAALPIDGVDLAVVEPGETLFPHPHRIVIEGPLIAPAGRAGAPLRAEQERLRALTWPRLVVVLGRGCAGADGVLARVAPWIAQSVRLLAAAVVVLREARFEDAEWTAFTAAIGADALVYDGGVDGVEEAVAWSALRATGDVFVLVGSADRWVAEACATGRPVFSYALDVASRPRAGTGSVLVAGLRDVLERKLIERAQARPANDRGTTRPQEGLEWLAARLVESGRVQPRMAPGARRARLLETGRVRRFERPITSEDLVGFPTNPPNDLERVVTRVRAMLGTAEPESR